MQGHFDELGPLTLNLYRNYVVWALHKIAQTATFDLQLQTGGEAQLHPKCESS